MLQIPEEHDNLMKHIGQAIYSNGHDAHLEKAIDHVEDSVIHHNNANYRQAHASLELATNHLKAHYLAKPTDSSALLSGLAEGYPISYKQGHLK